MKDEMNPLGHRELDDECVVCPSCGNEVYCGDYDPETETCSMCTSPYTETHGRVNRPSIAEGELDDWDAPF